MLFTEQYSDYPSGTWTATLWLSIGNTAPVSIAGTTSGTGFLFTITQAQSALLASGTYRYSQVVTNGTQTETPKDGTVNVLPNFTVAHEPTFNETQVTLLKTILAEFATTSKLSVNFNGQSFTRASIGEYQRQLVYFQAQVIAEQAAIDRARGGKDTGRIPVRFAPQGWTGPFNTPYCRQ